MRYTFILTGTVASLLAACLMCGRTSTTPLLQAREKSSDSFAAEIRPILATYCYDCHSSKAKKGGLDLEKYRTLEEIRREVKPWLQMIEQIETGEMPPKEKPQPTAEQKKKVVQWVRHFLDDEAKSRRGDPGSVPLRRLSNAEFDATIRDLTGVDLRPTREFPVDSAGGEGFTNAAESLTDISPALLTKYLNAARELAAHAVLLPDGFRFSAGKTRRDWSDDGVAKLRAFYARFATADGKLAVQPYLAATLKYRDALLAKSITLEAVAAKEKLNPRYLAALWGGLTDTTPSQPLDDIRSRWKTATEKDLPSLVNAITYWQTELWRTGRVGSYMRPEGAGYRENYSRQIPQDAAVMKSHGIRLPITPKPRESDVFLRFIAEDLLPGKPDRRVVWQNPRFEGSGLPTLRLVDYATYGPSFEVDYPAIFGETAKYLAAVAEIVRNPNRTTTEIAKANALDEEFLKRWIRVLDLEPRKKADPNEIPGRVVPVATLELLTEKSDMVPGKPAITGWRKKGIDLPIVLANSSATVEMIPGRAGAKGIMVHPTPSEFVAVAWKSPVTAKVRISGKVSHAHPACGNGVAWWLEHRRGDRATMFAEGQLDLGKQTTVAERTFAVQRGDTILIAVDAKANEHTCDLTEIALTITDVDNPGKIWDLSGDLSGNITAGNPHADTQGNADVWSFVKGPSRPVGAGVKPLIPADSILGKWHEAAGDPKRHAELPKLAEAVQKLLITPYLRREKTPDWTVSDNLVSVESVLLKGLDRSRLPRSRNKSIEYGLAKDRFDAKGNIVATSGTGTFEFRMPVELFRGRQLVVEATMNPPADDRVVRFLVMVNVPEVSTDAGPVNYPVVGVPGGSGERKLRQGSEAFRNLFPLFTCFPAVIPTDEVVSLKMFHREDDPLVGLFLDDEQIFELDKLWAEHEFVSRQGVLENEHLPQFIGFVTQDQPKAMQLFFESQMPHFQARADRQLKGEISAIPRQMRALEAFAAKAFRRPLTGKETAELRAVYESIRKKGTTHDEAFRGTLTRIFLSPAFLFRIEQSPAGRDPKPVGDWELATRLSYFLWSSQPDDELRSLAAAGKLQDPAVVAVQTQRMLRDPRLRNLAIEFGTQWIHVRGFDELKEKNERLFPTFTPELRKAISEESILYFQDLFQADRNVSQLLDSDATFLNETLAKHYGIPGVTGPQWRRVEGVKKYGRGGILGLASVQTKESGASRTSPILRGNWVVETLLGEKLPKPPANVPKLPEEEGGADKLTMRQQVERHVSEASCASCHQRIDPFGFALEKYDPIGRLREKDFGGLPLDSRAKLKDGTEFDGIDGLRNYLLAKKKDVIVRLFCKRLLGYALGRSVTLSDTSLVDEMVVELQKHDGRISAAVLTIIRSPQFRMVRGQAFEE
jgi:Protein of unknown function (DUF1592)/Protein of unknown function (DUF1588)/Protein of unknown function (DUF1587)/Protein of unknown function (DUF1585)/Protein of unknown function (DUF1595)/Planctomycete cytochrome C